ncbi:MAG TPA: cation-transporting P-type ATPase, partial [Anaerolineaceae bacterium]
MSPPFRPGNAPDAIAWHALEHVEVCDLLQVTPEVGLSETEVSQRLADFGPNSIEVPRGANLWAKIPEQVASPAALLLLGASLASYLLNRVVEGTAVLLSVLLTVIPSLVLIFQNRRNTPQNQLHLARMARVRRDGRLRIINPVQLVPGDVIHLTAGDLVPADARLTASISLRLHEERLTGSRHAVDKVPQAVRSGRP